MYIIVESSKKYNTYLSVHYCESEYFMANMLKVIIENNMNN